MIMKRFLVTLSVCAIVLSANAQYRRCIDEGWKFFRGAAINAESMDYDDSKWREVTVPQEPTELAQYWPSRVKNQLLLIIGYIGS